MEINEKKIIQACLAGDADAFEPLVTFYQPRVIALAWNILGSREEALDIAQETFIQAFKNLHLFDIQRNFKSWLMGITYKRALDRTRRRKTFMKFFQHQTRHANHEPPPSFQSLEESQLFQPLLNLLNQKERTALCLQVNESYSAREIAAVLACSEATARVHLFRAKKKLKKALAGNPVPGQSSSLERCSNDV